MEKKHGAKSNYKKAGVAMFISDNLDIKTQSATGDSKCYQWQKSSIHQGQEIILNLRAPNRAP